VLFLYKKFVSRLDVKQSSRVTQPRKKRRQKGIFMKREDVKAIFAEATDEQLNKIMGLHGADVEKYKGKVTALETENTEKKNSL